MLQNYKTVNEIANEWNINVRTVQTMCKDGRIPGAVKFGRSWAIPDNSEKPNDKRVSSGEYKNWRKKRE